MKPLRRKDREIPIHEARAILDRAEYGVLSTVDAEGQPYGLPISFVAQNDCIYFHCALTGHKLENIAHNPKVSFCVVGATQLLPEQFATAYESAVVSGVADEVTGAERLEALLGLLYKYCPDYVEQGKSYIHSKNSGLRVYRIKITQISGKARRQPDAHHIVDSVAAGPAA